MILSKKLGLIFIKGSKVGGTSVEIALSGLCGPDDIITPIVPIEDRIRIKQGVIPRNYAKTREEESEYIDRVMNSSEDELGEMSRGHHPFFNHMWLEDVEKRFDGNIDDFRIVCVERSPYDKVISLAKWKLHSATYKKGAGSTPTIDAVKKAVTKSINTRKYLRVRNLERYLTKDGSFTARLLRCENLQEDFAKLLNDLGVDHKPELPHAKKIVMDDCTPQNVYSREQFDAINDDFAQEFAQYGYATV